MIWKEDNWKNVCGDNKNNTVGYFQQMTMVWKGLIDAVHKGTPKYNSYWWPNRVERLASLCNPKVSKPSRASAAYRMPPGIESQSRDVENR